MRCVSPRRVRRRGGTSCLSSSPRALKMGRADVNACSGRDQSDAPVRRGLSHRLRGFLCSPWSHQDPARALRRRPRKRPAKALVQRANLLLEPSKAFWQGESLIAPSHWPRWVMWRSLGAGFGTQLDGPAGPKRGVNRAGALEVRSVHELVRQSEGGGLRISPAALGTGRRKRLRSVIPPPPSLSPNVSG
jgi:hypothetical protein